MGLMLAGLFGGPASAAEVELFVYQNDYQNPYGYQYPWGQQDYRGQHDPWGQQDRWGYRHDRRRIRYTCPIATRFTKVRSASCSATRIRGSREYHCREYRC